MLEQVVTEVVGSKAFKLCVLAATTYIGAKVVVLVGAVLDKQTAKVSKIK